MRLLEAPQTWIAVAVVLLVIAIGLLLLARRSRRKAVRTVTAGQGGTEAPTDPQTPDAQTPDACGPNGRASYDPDTDGADPTTDPVDLRSAVPSGAGEAPTSGPTPDRHAPDRHAPDQHAPAKDRLLAALLEDPQAAVHAVTSIDAANGSGPPGASVASLLRAGMSPAQVASLCRVRESALAEIVARDLGLLTARKDTAEPGTAWPSLASAAGSTTPTTG